MGALSIDERFSAVHTLTDGTRVRLRMLRPEDRERLRAGFERLSPQSRYRRFLSPTPRLTERMLTYLTHADGRDHVAIGAERVEPDGRGGEGLGVARFIRLADAPDTAEAAVAVVDDVQGRGLGRLLLATLVEAACERGIRKFRAHVLPGNAPVDTLLGDLAGRVSPAEADGFSAYEVTLPPAAVQESVLYRVLRAAAAGMELVLRTVGLGESD